MNNSIFNFILASRFDISSEDLKYAAITMVVIILVLVIGVNVAYKKSKK